MTNAEIKDYYADFLIIQYVGKTRARATIKQLADMVIMNQLPTSVMNAYDIDTAVGVQLDVIGKYVGATRTGFGFSETISLTDADFRILIRFAIVRNNSGSSLSEIQALLTQFFADQVLVFDYQNMNMSYLIDSNLGSQDLIQLLVNEGLLPKPMGVQLGSVIYAPVITEFFGMWTYWVQVLPNNPFNDYAGYQMDWPWLSYGDAVTSSIPANISMTTEDGDIIVQEDGGGLFT